MPHHKRHRPKNARAGCLLCKPHKVNGANDATVQERRAEEPRESAARRGRKNTLKWCFGREGSQHLPRWVDLGRENEWNGDWLSRWVLRCETCKKYLGEVHTWRFPSVVVRSFPGNEKFKSGPPELKLGAK
jgi:hypothetical protein